MKCYFPQPQLDCQWFYSLVSDKELSHHLLLILKGPSKKYFWKHIETEFKIALKEYKVFSKNGDPKG